MQWYECRSFAAVVCFNRLVSISIQLHFSIGSLIITITGMKLLRSSFTATARQHIVLIWTVLFFEYDYRGNSETFPIDYFLMSIFVDKVVLYIALCSINLLLLSFLSLISNFSRG